MPLEPLDLMQRLNTRNAACEKIVQRTYEDLLRKLKEHDAVYIMHDVMRKVIQATIGYDLDLDNVDKFADDLEALRLLLEEVGGSRGTGATFT